MISKNLPDPVLISTQTDLLNLIEALSEQPLVAVDTEANSLYAYREQVCLIQFSIPDIDFLVDPLALDDLTPLGSIFNHPKIEKIFHAAEYDLIILQRDFGFSFDCLFDTMVAARILGWKSVGLSSILKSQFGVNVNKKYQRANWGRRPLPSEMLTYAQLDTHYLIPLRNHLKAELKSQGRWEIAIEDFQRARDVGIDENDQKLPKCWRINGVQDLTDQQVAVLHELCRFRDQIARNLDRPLFKVIGDKSLLRIAEMMPDALGELERIHGVSRKQVRWIGKGLLSAVRRGSRKQPPPRPRVKRLSDSHLNRIDQLRMWRKRTARAMRVQSDIILPKDLMLILASKNPQSKQELGKILQSVPWRFEKYGDEIFNLLRATTS